MNSDPRRYLFNPLFCALVANLAIFAIDSTTVSSNIYFCRGDHSRVIADIQYRSDEKARRIKHDRHSNNQGGPFVPNDGVIAPGYRQYGKHTTNREQIQ